MHFYLTEASMAPLISRHSVSRPYRFSQHLPCPPGLSPKCTFGQSDLRQARYAHGDDAVSLTLRLPSHPPDNVLIHSIIWIDLRPVFQ